MVKSHKQLLAILVLMVSVVPLFALGQLLDLDPGTGEKFDLIKVLTVAIDIFRIIASGFVIVMFVFAGFKYLTAEGDATKVKEANRAVMWGVAGVIVIWFSFNIINIVRQTFNVA